MEYNLCQKEISFNDEAVKANTLDGTELELVDDCKYLGAWITSSEKYAWL